MTISPSLRREIRQQAGFACQYCGVHEEDAGGELTIDHFRPQSKGGESSLDNLLYCCIRCNQYKKDYWPTDASMEALWQPQKEPFDQYFVALDDGTLSPQTPKAAFSIFRLRLNRPALIAHRKRKLVGLLQTGSLSATRRSTRAGTPMSANGSIGSRRTRLG